MVDIVTEFIATAGSPIGYDASVDFKHKHLCASGKHLDTKTGFRERPCLKKIMQKSNRGSHPMSSSFFCFQMGMCICTHLSIHNDTLSFTHSKCYLFLVYFHCLGSDWPIQLQQLTVYHPYMENMRSGY